MGCDRGFDKRTTQVGVETEGDYIKARVDGRGGDCGARRLPR